MNTKTSILLAILILSISLFAREKDQKNLAFYTPPEGQCDQWPDSYLICDQEEENKEEYIKCLVKKKDALTACSIVTNELKRKSQETYPEDKKFLMDSQVPADLCKQWPDVYLNCKDSDDTDKCIRKKARAMLPCIEYIEKIQKETPQK